MSRSDDTSQKPAGEADEKQLLPIGKAAQQAGLSRQSVQYYLMLGLLEPTQTTPTGRRLFGPKAIERLRLIKHLNASGYTLRAIRELFLRHHN
ncbi:MAG: MerR family transcriptional regulator [Planctomycetes bacterium]|jgi:MerR family mercuric resistance operon transcriptional regulator|nr:MerR family transcriptional regulator [Planctomycetota bacterium]